MIKDKNNKTLNPFNMLLPLSCVFSILVALSIVCKPTATLAQSFYPAQSQALGEAGRASIEGLDAHFLNPAALPLSKMQYQFAGLYRSGQPGTDSPTSTFGAVVLDNNAEAFASAALSYLNVRRAYPDRTVYDNELMLSLGSRVLERISVGGSFKRLARGDSSGGHAFTKYNANLGFLFIVAPSFGIAFVGNDLLNDDDLDFVPQLSLGVNWDVMQIFKLKADVSRYEKKNPEKKGKLGAGIEFDAGEGFKLRTGGIWDGYVGSNFWTAGIGWDGPKLCLEYAYKSNMQISGDAAHTFDLRLDF